MFKHLSAGEFNLGIKNKESQALDVELGLVAEDFLSSGTFHGSYFFAQIEFCSHASTYVNPFLSTCRSKITQSIVPGSIVFTTLCLRRDRD